MFINRISASKSDIIDQCLWKYYLKYVLKIQGFETQNGEALNFGSFIHKIFETGVGIHDSKQLYKLSEELKSTYHIPYNLEDRTKKCIEHFIVWNSQLGETLSTEFAYEISLDEANDIKHNGVIDRIVKGKNGGYLVIDYKTSKKEKKKVDLMSDKQLMGYTYAVSQLYKAELKDIWCAHYYPVTGNFIVVQFPKISIVQWKKKEIDKVWRIRKKTKDDFPPQTNIFCDYCEFQKVCEKFETKENVCSRLDEQIKIRDQKALEKATKISNDSKESENKK